MRDFEKISYTQFAKDVSANRALYDEFPLPTRDSKRTAGYDFYLLADLNLAPGEIIKIPTGVKAFFANDEVLLLIVRSSTGFKYNIRLCNQVGVIDADYYGNPDNEGHIWMKLQNESEKTLSFSKGSALVQGIFMKYLATESDNHKDKQRGGAYSTPQK